MEPSSDRISILTRRDRKAHTLSLSAPSEDMWESSSHKPGRQPSPETEFAGTDQTSRTVRNKCLLFKPSTLWYFVKAALADSYTVYT